MAGIDDSVAIIGDWMPPSPSPRSFFPSMLCDDVSTTAFSETSGGYRTEGLFLGQGEQMMPRNDKEDVTQTGNSDHQFNNRDLSPEQGSSSRGGLVTRLAARTGFSAPKLNTENIRPPDISANPDIVSPYLTIPPGLSPTTLLDSPVFLSNSLAQPSPTTGQFPLVRNGNTRSSTMISGGPDRTNNNFFEDIHTASFAFKPILESGPYFSNGAMNKQSIPSIEVSVHSDITLQSKSLEPTNVQSQNRNIFQLQADTSRLLSDKSSEVNTLVADRSADHSPPMEEQEDEECDHRGSGDSVACGTALSEDGYNWRKYGQKQVKGSEYPRSYYKCTHPNCQVKKKVERSHEGHITEIIYKEVHNHLKPSPNRRLAIGTSDLHLDRAEQTRLLSGADGDPDGGTPDWRHENFDVTSSTSVSPELCNPSTCLEAQNGTHFESGDALDASSNFSNDEDVDDQGTHGSISLGYDGGGDESEPKKRKIEAYATEMSGATKAIREPRVVVQTTSEVDILDDGYRWRKYGQKVVKGNPNPRSYYKCTNAGCTVRKHVERASHDLKFVITTYEGKHNHDVPAARNSSHVNSGTSSTVTTQAAAAIQTHIHRPESSQLHKSMARFERPASLNPFAVPGRQQLGPLHGFPFATNQPGLGNPPMAKMPVLPIHPYLGQQRHGNEMGFMLPKGEPKLEPALEPGMNLSNSSIAYQQIMSRLGPQM